MTTVLALVAYCYVVFPPKKGPKKEIEAGVKVPQLKIAQEITPQAKSPQLVKKNPDAIMPAKMPIQVPNRDQIQQEVAADPHHTPISLLNFGASLGQKMERALESEAEAFQLFSELKGCVLDSANIDTIQAICLSNAEIIAENYPKFEEHFSDLKDQASPDALRLIEN